MTYIPFFGSDYRRQVAQEPYIQLVNRFAEQNPALNDTPVSVIARPALKKCAEVGTGPIRKTYSSPGVFDGDAFVVSGTELYRVDTQLNTELIGEISTNSIGDVSMATTAPIGTVPAYLYIAEGGVLWCYTEEAGSRGTLQASNTIATGYTAEIDGIYYEITNGDVNAGTPDGSSGNPWLVALGITNLATFANLFNAVNGLGGDYSSDLVEHPTVNATSYGDNDLSVQAKEPGLVGDAYTTTSTGANWAWGGATLSGGGDPALYQISTPDDLGAISIAHINSYIIVVPVQTDDAKGRFYWIQPGENVIDPLDFATAERNPDGVLQVLVYGDMFWLFGQNTTEPWVTTGNIEAPMQRFRGILFDRGSWEGTAVQVKDSLIVVDEDGGVFMIKGGQKRISRPDIEERIRRAKQTQTVNTI